MALIEIVISTAAGWDETNFSGRDLEIRLMKNHYETETEKVDAEFLKETRPRRDCFFLCPRRDRDKT